MSVLHSPPSNTTAVGLVLTSFAENFIRVDTRETAENRGLDHARHEQLADSAIRKA